MVSKNGLKFTVLSILLVAMLAMTGCGKSADENTNPNQDHGEEQVSETLSGNIQLAGSTSVQPLAEELATIFMEKNTEVKIDVQGGGSGAGIKAAAEGE
jgi:phosphate transport system substrate-binding protein